MSVYTALNKNYYPSKDLFIELSKVYTGKKKKFDLKKITADEHKNLTALDSSFDKLQYELNKLDIEKYLEILYNCIEYDNLIGSIQEVVLFKDLNLVLKYCMYDSDCFNSVVDRIIKEKITFVQNGVSLPLKSLDYFNNSVEKIYKGLLEYIVEFFEDWQGERSITCGGVFVKLCDYLKIKVKPIDESPNDWNVPEYEFSKYAGNKGNKRILRDFARLFSKHPSCWYCDPWWE